MGIPINSILKYKDKDKDIEVIVTAEKKVKFNDKETSLTAVTREILGLDYSVQPSPYWIYEGRRLKDIYEDTYTLDNEEI